MKNLFMKKTFTFLLTFCVFLFIPISGKAKVYIDITSPGARRIPIAIPEFRNLERKEPLDGRIVSKLNAVLESDLKFTGLFDILDKASYIEDPDRAGLTSRRTDFQDWRVIDAELLIKGGYKWSRGNNNITVEIRLFDVVREKMLVGQRYHGKASDLRRIIHRFSNKVMQAVTGEKGVFETRIAFVSKRSGNKEIYISDFDGYNTVPLTKNGSINISPQWSPDGRWMLFTSFKDNQPYLYRKSLKTGKTFRIFKYPGVNIGGRWSPSGKEIAFTLSKDGNPELYRYNLRTGALKRLTRNWGIDVSPSWSPDGGRLAFVSDMAGKPNIYVMDANGKHIKRLTYKGKYNSSPSWSPKGDKIAFSRLEDGQFDIWVMSPDGSDKRRLTASRGNDEDPSWAPNARYIAFKSDRDGYDAIYIISVEGGKERMVLKGSNPSWSPE